jgi:hypothetical protein
VNRLIDLLDSATVQLGGEIEDCLVQHFNTVEPLIRAARAGTEAQTPERSAESWRAPRRPRRKNGSL